MGYKQILEEMNKRGTEELIDANLVAEKDTLEKELTPLLAKGVALDLEQQKKLARYEELCGETGLLSKLGKDYINRLKEAKAEEDKPIILKEVNLNPRETSIMELSENARAQVMFRMANFEASKLNSIDATLVTIQALLMALADSRGLNVQDIVDKGIWQKKKK